ncbi:hypothetical protein BCV69DRAFT_80845 [Microstroma glucosiphilum]|uniref:Uncharacterized protein n=1 Tax=Pseudomicrostroma glucosiphilum TaxID=1684307 RepID=A0A316TYJ3_9BASI|nr:hypothetical protein BCV69DRAFT_80845 [Pseudomicrostroma glucosiphilum]PWN18292.1 hypothetical protein BCV69DRAFT_80845 [Pseudomicrostroma glucosiphilum]
MRGREEASPRPSPSPSSTRFPQPAHYHLRRQPLMTPRQAAPLLTMPCSSLRVQLPVIDAQLIPKLKSPPFVLTVSGSGSGIARTIERPWQTLWCCPALYTCGRTSPRSRY